MKPLIIYHGGGCPDGLCGAWIAWKHFGKDVDFLPASYKPARHGDEQSKLSDYIEIDVAGRDVYIVDFSYPREVVKQIAAVANKLVILDHHNTAQKALTGLQDELGINSTIVFDMEKSGARLAWDFFNPDLPVPHIVLFVEDRDLWRWSLPMSREINAAISSKPLTVESFENLSTVSDDELYDAGNSILQYQYREIEELVSKAALCDFAGHVVPIVNNSVLSISSEIGQRLAKDRPFGIIWFQKQDGSYYYSLRSIIGEKNPIGMDVSEVAKSLGGGGHKQASGVTSPVLLHEITKKID